MEEKLSIPEQRLLWALVDRRGEAFESDLKLSNGKPLREALVRAKLIEIERLPSPKSKRMTNFLLLTDAGWAWCNRHMEWSKPRGKAENLLNSMLQRLKTLMERHEAAGSLAEFVNKTAPSGPASAPSHAEEAVVVPTNVTDRIRSAYFELSGGREAVRVRLADLRQRLNDVPKDLLTVTIRELSERNELVLFSFDDPRQITPADEAAAIDSSTGVPQHILYIGGIAS